MDFNDFSDRSDHVPGTNLHDVVICSYYDPMKTVTLTLLANNVVQRPGLLAEHGLAFWLECGGRRLLFDTGQGLVLRHNAAALGFRLGTVTDVVLSHGHYDHTGGLAPIADSAQTAPQLWLHPAATAARYSRHKDGSMHEIGMPAASRNGLGQFRRRDTSAGGGMVEIIPGIFATGPVRRRHAEEAVTGFFLDAEGRQADDIPDDQALWFDTDAGVVALLGCAHAGCINTLEQIQAQAGGRRPFAAIIGGTHLGNASGERLDWTVQALRRLAPKLLVPLHCTGDAIPRLKTEFPDACRLWGVGDSMTFEVKEGGKK